MRALPPFARRDTIGDFYRSSPASTAAVGSDLTTACRRLCALSQCVHLHGNEVMTLVAKAKKRAKPKKPIKAKKPVRRAPNLSRRDRCPRRDYRRPDARECAPSVHCLLNVASPAVETRLG